MCSSPNTSFMSVGVLDVTTHLYIYIYIWIIIQLFKCGFENSLYVQFLLKGLRPYFVTYYSIRNSKGYFISQCFYSVMQCHLSLFLVYHCVFLSSVLWDGSLFLYIIYYIISGRVLITAWYAEGTLVSRRLFSRSDWSVGPYKAKFTAAMLANAKGSRTLFLARGP